MDEYIKVSAKTVEDAILEASIQLKTSSDNIDYRVIDAGSRGFLGIGAKKATIEAKVKKTNEEFVDELLEKNSEAASRKTKKKENKENKEAKGKEPKEAKEPKEVKEPKEAKEAKETKEPKEAKEAKEVKEPKEAKKKAEKASAKGEGEKPEKKEKTEKPEKKAPKPPKAAKENKKETKPVLNENEAEEESAVKVPKEPLDPKIAMERAEKFLKDVFAAMNQDVVVKQTWDEDSLQIELEGEGMGVLIGKRGKTLDSLQYLVSLVVNQGNAAYVRVKLDTENYRERRKATLENLAKNIAFKVKKTRKPVYLEPMNPYERRIIHSALQNDPFVTTHSEGEEPCRKVVVTMKKRDRLPYRDMESDE